MSRVEILNQQQEQQEQQEQDTPTAIPASQYINDFAVWTSDDLVSHCMNCSTRFTFLNRKHHCRCCGGIFCGACSDYFLWYNEEKIKVVENGFPYLSGDHDEDQEENSFINDIDRFQVLGRTDMPPYRTCVTCASDLRRRRLLLSYQQYCNKGFADRMKNPSQKKNSNNRKDKVVVLEEEEEEEADGQESVASSSVPPGAYFTDTDSSICTTTNESSLAIPASNDNSLFAVTGPLSARPKVRKSSQNKADSVSTEYMRCPICNKNLKKLSEQASQDHINECLQKAECVYQHTMENQEQDPTFHNRMLVYTIKPRSNSTSTIGELLPTIDTVVDEFDSNAHAIEDTQEYPECPICFEEMLPGEKVGRLECICVYHYDCIKSWFAKKRLQNKQSTKNWCPTHDALSS